MGPNELSELSAPPFSPKVVLGPTSEVGKWPDQNGQSRLSAPVSEFVEAGEPIERRSQAISDLKRTFLEDGTLSVVAVI